jgi:hypothetical protein
VAVDNLPLAVLAAVDVGDAQGVRLDRNAVDGHRGVFVADRIGQVPTDACAGLRHRCEWLVLPRPSGPGSW